MKKWIAVNVVAICILTAFLVRPSRPTRPARLIKITPTEAARWRGFIREVEDTESRVNEVHDNILRDMAHQHGVDEQSTFDFSHGYWICPVTSES